MRSKAIERIAAVALAIVTAWLVVLVLTLLNGCSKAETPEPEQPKLHKTSPVNLILNGGGEGTTDWAGAPDKWRFRYYGIGSGKVTQITGSEWHGYALYVSHPQSWKIESPRFNPLRRYHELTFRYRTDSEVIVWLSLPNNCSIELGRLYPTNGRVMYYNATCMTGTWDHITWYKHPSALGTYIEIDEVNLIQHNLAKP